MMNKSLPIKCNKIDHYTLIVPNAKAVSDFHVHVLGYQFKRIQLVNAGSAPKGKYDMLNYVLAWPNDPERILVITEGLTENSIFKRFMGKYGQGIHHIAFEVDDMDDTFGLLQQAGIPMTSDKILNDLLTGLKQVFLDNKHTGVFVELIERPTENSGSQASEAGFFTHDNMAGLAQTMTNYIEQQKQAVTDTGLVDYTPEGNYYATDQAIEGVTPHHYILGISNVSDSSNFFTNTLDLHPKQQSEQEITLSLQSEVKPSLTCRVSQNLPYCELNCTVKSLQQTRQILSSLKISYQIEKNDLVLDKLYAGYPLRLCEGA